MKFEPGNLYKAVQNFSLLTDTGAENFLPAVRIEKNSILTFLKFDSVRFKEYMDAKYFLYNAQIVFDTSQSYYSPKNYFKEYDPQDEVEFVIGENYKLKTNFYQSLQAPIRFLNWAAGKMETLPAGTVLLYVDDRQYVKDTPRMFLANNKLYADSWNWSYNDDAGRIFEKV